MATADDRRMHAAVALAGLAVENRRLATDAKTAEAERRQLEREITLKDEELESLSASCFETEAELRDARRKKERWALEKSAMEKAYSALDHESTSIILALVAAQTDLEERLERKGRALKVLSGIVMGMLKEMERKVRRDVEDEAELDGWDMMEENELLDADIVIDMQALEAGAIKEKDEGMADMIKPFTDQIKKINAALEKTKN